MQTLWNYIAVMEVNNCTEFLFYSYCLVKRECLQKMLAGKNRNFSLCVDGERANTVHFHSGGGKKIRSASAIK